jgi:hypothetical protein
MTLATTYPTLVDIYNRLDNKGNIDANIIEVLAKTNRFMMDIPWAESNLPTGHKTTIRTSLPSSTKRKLNQGVAPTKSNTRQIVDTMANFEARSAVDLTEVKINNNKEGWRFSEDMAFIEGMNQDVAYSMFYGNEAADEADMNGLHIRYNALSSTYGEPGNQIIDCGGTSTDNTSIWLIGWGPNSVMGIHAPGLPAGLSYRDLGEMDAYDASSNPFRALVSLYQWTAGLSVRNYMNIVRLANIDYSDIKTSGQTTDTSANLMIYMSRAIDMIQNPDSVNLVFYVNRWVMSYLRIQMLNKANIWLTESTYTHGITGITTPEMRFLGIPVRRCDSLSVAEARIV